MTWKKRYYPITYVVWSLIKEEDAEEINCMFNAM